MATARHLVGRIWGGIRKTGSTAMWAGRLALSVSRHRRDQRLTVAVDVSAFWEPLAGIGWYLYRLLEHLADYQQLSIQMYPPTIVHSDDLSDPTVELPRGPALELLRYDVPTDEVLFAGTVTRLLRRLEPVLIAAHRSRVLFAPNYFLPRRFALASGTLVATIHDLGFKRVPWTLRDETLEELSTRLDRTLSRARQLITVSSAVRDELIGIGYPRPESVHVVHHGPGQLATLTSGRVPPGTPSYYGLHVGTLEPRKNITTLLEAWRLLRDRVEKMPVLLLCGRYGWKTREIERDVEAGELEGWLRHLGYVADQELAALYAHAAVVVFPSIYEGFGLPAVEAQWAGVPLVCSDLPVLREVAGDGAVYAPPDRPDRLAEAIARVLVDARLRERLIRDGRRAVERLSWQRAAAETLGVWRLAAGKPPIEGGKG